MTFQARLAFHVLSPEHGVRTRLCPAKCDRKQGLSTVYAPNIPISVSDYTDFLVLLISLPKLGYAWRDRTLSIYTSLTMLPSVGL